MIERTKDDDIKKREKGTDESFEENISTTQNSMNMNAFWPEAKLHKNTFRGTQNSMN